MVPTEIHEAGLTVRPWQSEDADAVYRACQDPLIQRWTSLPGPYLREHAETFTAGALAAWEAGRSAPAGVFDEATGELLGSSGLVTIDHESGWGELGYWTAPWARGRGVATRAARAVARWALGPLRLRRVVWRAEVGNHASRLVAERIGVRVEGVHRQALNRPGGSAVDSWSGSVLTGELREETDPLSPTVTLRAVTFGNGVPTLELRTEPGEKITLRPPLEADLDDIVLACRDPESVRWTTVPDPYGPADATFFATVHAPVRWARGEAAVFAIADARGRFAGSMDLRLLDELGTGGVGYLVAPWARGRGYASTALREVCRWGVERLGLERIEWSAYLGNEASKRVAQKAGFTVEGVARAGCLQRGVRLDAWTGALLAADLA